MILVGQAMEDKLTDIFRHNNVECIPQAKEVIKIYDVYDQEDNGIDLVVKPDYLFDDFLIETKFTFSTGDLIERYKYQLEAEFRAFERQVYSRHLIFPF